MAMTAEREPQTEQQKREDLARWEGWTNVKEEVGRRPDAAWTILPDYWNDGNAMLRLLGRIEESSWGWEIEAPPAGIDVLVHTGDWTSRAFAVNPIDLPMAVAEAVWEAIQ